MQAPLEYDHEERTRFLVEAIQHQATNAQLAQSSTPPTSHAFLLALLGLWAEFAGCTFRDGDLNFVEQVYACDPPVLDSRLPLRLNYVKRPGGVAITLSVLDIFDSPAARDLVYAGRMEVADALWHWAVCTGLVCGAYQRGGGIHLMLGDPEAWM